MNAVYIPTVCPVPCHPTRIQEDPAVYTVLVYSRGDQIRQLSQLELLPPLPPPAAPL
jgi:hypothetical protein